MRRSLGKTLRGGGKHRGGVSHGWGGVLSTGTRGGGRRGRACVVSSRQVVAVVISLRLHQLIDQDVVLDVLVRDIQVLLLNMADGVRFHGEPDLLV